MTKKKLRVGFDFDGVVAYNPFRIVRPIVAYIKHRLLGVKKLKFYYPKNRWQQIFWLILHESSIFPAKGIEQLKKLVKEGKIEAHLVTARYSFLDSHLYGWLDKYGLRDVFKTVNMNEKDEQPHKFKERVIRKLRLDYFVEDNWDIVKYLSTRLNISNSKLKTQNSKLIQNSKLKEEQLNSRTMKQWSNIEIHWIYNILDRRIDYPYKHPYLEKFLESITDNCGFS